MNIGVAIEESQISHKTITCMCSNLTRSAIDMALTIACYIDGRTCAITLEKLEELKKKFHLSDSQVSRRLSLLKKAQVISKQKNWSGYKGIVYVANPYIYMHSKPLYENAAALFKDTIWEPYWYQDNLLFEEDADESETIIP